MVVSSFPVTEPGFGIGSIGECVAVPEFFTVDTVTAFHPPILGYAARKVDQSAAQKVSHLEGGSFYADLLRRH